MGKTLAIASTMLLMTAGLAAPAAAQDAKTLLGGGFAILHEEGLTPIGFNIDFSQDVIAQPQRALAVVGDFAYTNDSAAEESVRFIAGGVRFYGRPSGGRFSAFGEFLIGAATGSTPTATFLAWLPGGGILVRVNGRVHALAKINIAIMQPEEGRFTGTRFTVGVVMDLTRQ